MYKSETGNLVDYDQAGNLTSITYPDTTTVVERTIDSRGRIDVISKGTTSIQTDVVSYEYVGSRVGRRVYDDTNATYPVTYTIEYDDFGRADRHYTYQNTTDITDFGYTYDKNSNITDISFDHRSSTPDNTYTYDDLNRLTGVEYLSDNQDTESFTMDDLGNRDSVTLRDGTPEDYHIDPLTNRYRGIDGPLAQWKFDEDSGETAYDSIGSNDGSITDDTSENSQWITGLFDGGLNFISTGGSSGTDGDYVQMADFSDEINNSDFSVSLWVCPDTVSVVQEMVLLGTAYNIHDLEFYQYYDDLEN